LDKKVLDIIDARCNHEVFRQNSVWMHLVNLEGEGCKAQHVRLLKICGLIFKERWE